MRPTLARILLCHSLLLCAARHDAQEALGALLDELTQLEGLRTLEANPGPSTPQREPFSATQYLADCRTFEGLR